MHYRNELNNNHGMRIKYGDKTIFGAVNFLRKEVDKELSESNGYAVSCHGP